MKLYELTESLLNLENVLENIEEGYEEVIQESLNEIQGQLNDKVENIVKLIKNLEADGKAIKEEEQRLQKMRKKKEKQIEGLKDYLFTCISSLDKREVKGGIFTVGIKKNPVSVVVEDLNTIPTEYIVNTPTVDKKALKEALKDGEIIKGARLEQKESLKIK